jgi:hypothetical protein
VSQEESSIYLPPDGSSALRQGEILTSVVEIRLVEKASLEGTLRTNLITHPYAVIVSQDCDLEQDYDVRKPIDPDSASMEAKEISKRNAKLLPSILLCQAVSLVSLRGRGDFVSDLWKRVVQNDDPRYHSLEKCPSNADLNKSGLPALGIDFKRYFTIPADELYYRISTGETLRRSCMKSPYFEHLTGRFFAYQSRIGLPTDHSISSTDWTAS